MDQSKQKQLKSGVNEAGSAGFVKKIMKNEIFWRNHETLLNQQKTLFEGKMMKTHEKCGPFKTSLLRQVSVFFEVLFLCKKSILL